MPYVDTKMVFQDQYEIKTGIFNHLGTKERPLSSVAMFPCEDYSRNSPYYDIIKEFALNDYGQLWNMSLEEYLSLPSWRSKLMREIATEVKEKKLSNLEAAKREMGI